MECSFGKLVRRWGILWRSLEVETSCSHWLLHKTTNFCVDAIIEVHGELMKRDDNVEVVPGLSMVPPWLNQSRSPVDNLTTECRCENCSRTGRAHVKSDTSKNAPSSEYREMEVLCDHTAVLGDKKKDSGTLCGIKKMIELLIFYALSCVCVDNKLAQPFPNRLWN